MLGNHGDGVLIKLSVEGCDPVDIGAAAAIFWQAEVEQSCQEENGAGSPVCLMFTTYYPYIETPFMVVVPYEDTNLEVLDTLLNTRWQFQVHPCTPPLDEQPDFWETWRAEMYQLALQLVEVFFMKDYMVLLENYFFNRSLWEVVKKTVFYGQADRKG